MRGIKESRNVLFRCGIPTKKEKDSSQIEKNDSYVAYLGESGKKIRS